MTCLIVEDEPLAAEIIQDYVRQVPFLNLYGICTDALFALDVMQREKIDLLFLDINLPGIKGLDFLRSITHPPKVIITTAYHDYAIEGYSLNVVDYLLKPVSFNRFLMAVNKANTRQQPEMKKQTITIQADKKNVIIPVDEIIFIESQKEYIKIQTEQKNYTTKYSLTKIEEELDTALFLRIHRSFIIAILKINAYNASEIEISGKTITIGGSYKEAVSKKLKAIYG